MYHSPAKQEVLQISLDQNYIYYYDGSRSYGRDAPAQEKKLNCNDIGRV